MSSLALADPALAPTRLTIRPAWIVAAMWLACCATMIALFHHGFATLGFSDPDDAMRLAQVRDWIGGQGWFDVSQHRVNPPLGGPMHWSRIVDMPIAGLILLLTPMVGAAGAEMLACILVPLILLGGLTAALYGATCRIAGRETGVLAALLLLTAPSILIQFTPLRIDHHGWQIAMAATALAGFFDPRPVRGGVVAALALAVWLQISSESLPYTALFAGAIALRQWIAREEARRFVGFAATLGTATLLLLVALRGPGAPFHIYCDAMSAAYLWPLVTFAVATPLVWRLIGTGSARQRFLIAAIGGGAAAGTLLMSGGPCLSGDPFQSLGPVAYKLWYVQVMEGRPIWEQSLDRMGSIVLPPLVGLGASLMAAHRARHDRALRDRWLLLALLLAGATAIAIMVMRALSVAHLFALPGIAWLILMLFRRVQASAIMPVRVLGSAALVLLSPAGLCSLWIALSSASDAEPAGPGKAGLNRCLPGASMAALTSLPRGTIFAPMDIGPSILIRTDHAVVGTGHHRNAAGITAVIQGFMDRPEQARAVIGRLNGGKGATYVVTCTDLNEYKFYAKEAPQGLAAMLARGQTPGWLHPLPGDGAIHVYRVVAQPGTKAIATPFMQ